MSAVAASAEIGKLPRALRRGPSRVPLQQLDHREAAALPHALCWSAENFQLRKNSQILTVEIFRHMLLLLGFDGRPYFALVEIAE